MRSSAMPWKTVPLVGDYGRPAGDDLAGPRLGPVRARPGGGRFPAHYLDYTAGTTKAGTSSSWHMDSAAGGSTGHRTSPRSASGGGSSRWTCLVSAVPGRCQAGTGSTGSRTRSLSCADSCACPRRCSSATRSAGRWRCGSPPGTPTWPRRSCWWPAPWTSSPRRWAGATSAATSGVIPGRSPRPTSRCPPPRCRPRASCGGRSAGAPRYGGRCYGQVGGSTPKAGGRELDGRTWDRCPTK
jgi:hypothetical protein